MNNITKSLGVGRSEEETNMSLDIASHPGRTGTDELVPSRYALRVGEIDVLVISDGVLPLPATTLATNADPADLAAWLDDMRQPPDVFKWPLNVVVVRSGGRTVLIDAGIGAEFPDFPQAGRLGHATGRRRHRSRIRDRRGAYPHARGPRWRAARRRAEGPAASGRADPPGGRRGRVLGVARFLPQHFWRDAGRASVGRRAVRGRVPQPAAAVRDGVRGGAGGGRPSHRRPHPRAQRGPPGVRRRPADVPRRCRVPGPFRPPRLVQRFRPRPRGGGPRPGPSLAGAGGDPRAAGGRSRVVPVRRPGGGRRRRLSLGTGHLGVLTACWVRAELSAAPDRGRNAGPGR